MRSAARLQTGLAALAALLLLALAACKSVQIGRDALIANLPPDQAKVCRAAVRDELLDHGVSADWVRQTEYRAITATRSGGRSRITGFEAWVYPKNGNGALVIELNERCQVVRMWAHGTR